ncbi:hypothetical protein H1R20_g1035, partial [Candolleomyces eurysporus]
MQDTVNEEAPLTVAHKLATARREGRVSVMDSCTQPVEGFHMFLQAHFGVNVDDIPLERANEMRVVLEQHQLLTRCMDKAAAWKRKAGSGGYRVPNIEEYKEYVGVDFTKATIKVSLSLTGTKSSDDKSLLSDNSLSVAPKALNWAQNPDTKYCEKFDKMSPAQFKNYLKRKRGESRHLTVPTSDDDSGTRSEVAGQKVKDKKRQRGGGKDGGMKPQKKGRKEYHSDNVDASSSD